MSLSRFTSRQKIAFFLALIVSLFLAVFGALVILLNYYEWTRQEVKEANDEIATMVKRGERYIQEYMRVNSGPGHDDESVYWEKSDGTILSSGVFKRISFDPLRPVEIVEVPVHKENDGWEMEFVVGDDGENQGGEEEVHWDHFMLVFKETPIGRIGFTQNVNQYVFFEERLLVMSVFMFLLGLLVSLIVGYWAAGRILKPVVGIIEKTEKNSLHDLSRDLPIAGREDDVIVRLSRTLNDLFERVRVESEKMKQFNHDVSHELKTPLAIIRSDIELALKKKDMGGLKETLDEVGALTELINKLLFLAQDEGKIEMKKIGSGEILKIVEKAGKDLGKIYGDKKLKFSIEVEGEFGGKGNLDLLKNLLVNLMQNAFKFCLDGGEVRVVVGKKEILVANSADQIGKKELENLFQAFYKKDRSRSNDGYGIGLSVVKKICDLMVWEVKAGWEDGEFWVRVVV